MASTVHAVKIALLLMCGLALGILFRLYSLPAWLQHPDRVLVNKAPLLTEFDGYEYLRQAEAFAAINLGWQEEEVTKTAPDESPVDISSISGGSAVAFNPSQTNIAWLNYAPQRGAPDGVGGAPFSSFMAIITAVLIRLLPLPPLTIASVFPVLIAPLIFLSMYLLGTQLRGRNFGLLAGMLAVCAPAFVMRSSLGRYDTDCAIPFFTVMSFYLANRLYSEPQQKGRKVLLFLLGTNTLMFFWWWDNAASFALAVGFIAVFQAQTTSTLPCEIKRQINKSLVLVALLLLLIFTTLLGLDQATELVKRSFNVVTFLAHNTLFPAAHVDQLVMELQRWSLSETGNRLCGHWGLALFGLAGFILFIMYSPRFRPTLLSLLLIALLCLVGKRFAYFAVPAISLGSAYLIFFLWDVVKSNRAALRMSVRIIILLFILVQMTLCARILWHEPAWPPIPPATAEGLLHARKTTHPNALIWSWWDNGCAIMYYAQRATIEDNLFNTPERSAINALPLTLQDERTAANFMRFYATHGLRGIKYFQEETNSDDLNQQLALLSATPENAAEKIEAAGLFPVQKWLKFLFPAASTHPPLFLFLDYLYLPTVPVWYAYGTRGYTADKEVIPFMQYYFDVYVNGKDIRVDQFETTTDQGVLTQENHQIQLARLLIRHAKAVQEIDYHRSGLILEVDPANGWAVLCDPLFHDSIFNQLFFYGRHQTRHFQRIWDKTPYGQLWMVTPEQYGLTN